MYCINCKHFKKYKSKYYIGRCKKDNTRICDNLNGCLKFEKKEETECL